MTGWSGPALAGLAVFVILIGPLWFQDEGFPQIPTTGQFVNVLEQTAEHGMWLVVPLLIVYYTGELIWREREAGLSEIAGAAPVPVWVSFAGNFAGLALVLVAAQSLVMAAAMLVQARMGYYHFEVGLYARILFGIRLTDYLLFALLALVVHVVVEQKYVGHLIAIIAYVLVAFGQQLGIKPGLLVYGSDPGWTYSDMRGPEPFIRPWLLFKLYWVAWALVLAVAAKLLWPRGTKRGLWPRLRVARRRLTRRTAATYAHPINIRYQEGFSFINPVDDPRGIDLPFAVVAHEVAHQWWGHQLVPASVVGAPLLTESLAWYSALEVVEASHGREHRDRLLGAMRAAYLSPRACAARRCFGPPTDSSGIARACSRCTRCASTSGPSG